MTDKQLKKLSRVQLLEILVEQGKKIETLEQQLKDANKKLADREITLDHAGSIAQASLQLNEVFQKAQDAADQYIYNIELLYKQAQERFGAETVDETEQIAEETAEVTTELSDEEVLETSARETVDETEEILQGQPVCDTAAEDETAAENSDESDESDKE